MHGRDCGGCKHLDDEVAVGNPIERIRHWPIEAERLRGHIAVEYERGAGKCCGPEWSLVQALSRFRESSTVARGHLDIGKQVMPESYRLRRLHMRKPWHQGACMRQGLFGERTLIGGQGRIERIHDIAHPKPEISGDLVIARARSVQPARRLADQLR